jgi:hypothetical protein
MMIVDDPFAMEHSLSIPSWDNQTRGALERLTSCFCTEPTTETIDTLLLSFCVSVITFVEFHGFVHRRSMSV